MVLAILDWLPQFCADLVDIEVAEQGATLAELQQLEQDLGIPLPAAYKDCLQVWDGAADFGSWQIYSVAEIRSGVNYWGFQAGVSELGGEDYPFLYRFKPLALLPIAQQTHSADLFCFDTRQYKGQDYPIVEYDHEIWQVKQRYRCFADFLQAKAWDITEDLEFFLRSDRTDEEADHICQYWSERLRTE
ncbi:MAG: SMI1/KNR4 family protein [Spirulinaceae cyanobacterium]